MVPQKQKKQLTAQEKSQKGLPLTGSDIAELLKDPNHWLSKLYAECQIACAILREIDFINFVKASIRELELERRFKESANARAELSDKLAAMNIQKQPMIDAFQQIEQNENQVFASLNKTQLTIQLHSLLAMQQESMTHEQLVTHNEQITRLAHDQILAEMPNRAFTLQPDGSSAPIEIDLAQVHSSPSASIDKILKVNETLAKEVATSTEDVQKAFVANHTKQSTYGPVSVFGRLEDIRKAFNIDYISPNKFIPILKQIDAAAAFCLANNVSLLEHLNINNDLLFASAIKQLKQENKAVDVKEVHPSLAGPPAMFAAKIALKPTPWSSKKVNTKTAADDEWWQEEYLLEQKAKNKKG